MITCSNLDCERRATARLTYPGRTYELCAAHGAAGLDWLAAHHPALSLDAVLAQLGGTVSAEQQALFEEITP